MNEASPLAQTEGLRKLHAPLASKNRRLYVAGIKALWTLTWESVEPVKKSSFIDALAAAIEPEMADPCDFDDDQVVNDFMEDADAAPIASSARGDSSPARSAAYGVLFRLKNTGWIETYQVAERRSVTELVEFNSDALALAEFVCEQEERRRRLSQQIVWPARVQLEAAKEELDALAATGDDPLFERRRRAAYANAYSALRCAHQAGRKISLKLLEGLQAARKVRRHAAAAADPRELAEVALNEYCESLFDEVLRPFRVEDALLENSFRIVAVLDAWSRGEAPALLEKGAAVAGDEVDRSEIAFLLSHTSHVFSTSAPAQWESLCDQEPALVDDLSKKLLVLLDDSTSLAPRLIELGQLIASDGEAGRIALEAFNEAFEVPTRVDLGPGSLPLPPRRASAPEGRRVKLQRADRKPAISDFFEVQARKEAKLLEMVSKAVSEGGGFATNRAFPLESRQDRCKQTAATLLCAAERIPFSSRYSQGGESFERGGQVVPLVVFEAEEKGKRHD